MSAWQETGEQASGKNRGATASLVILHGWGSNSRSFDDVVVRLRAEGIEVITFDLPGFGTAQPPVEPWAVDDYVRFVADTLAKQNITRFYLLGHSFGGRVAIKYAVQFPDQIAGLILYDAAGIKPPVTLKLRLFRAAATLGRAVPGSFKRFFRKGLYALAGTRDYYRAKGVMRGTMRNVIVEDLEPFLSLIRARTLILWGDRDTETPLRDGELMHRAISGSRFYVQKGGGHSWHKEQPEVFAEAVQSFIKRDHA